jgi:tripartite-type tricarboxylate transporter receptor subunit TctC
MKFDLALAVGGKLPVRSLPELVAWLKANPEQATFGTPGAGAAPHFLGMELGRATKLDLRHVAYTSPSLPDLMTGRLPMAINTVAEFLEHHKSGSIRILATAGASRSRFLPDVPTLRESGFDLVAPNWHAMYAPAGTPANVAERLRAAILDALQNAEIRARIETLGFEVAGTPGEELARIQHADYERWGPIIKASGFKADQ